MAKILAVACVLIMMSAAQCRAEGLNALIEVGKSMADAKKTLDSETARYNKVKQAIGAGAIAKGQPKSAIRSRYGEPVIINEDYLTKRERWVYKSAGSSFFKGEIAYLFFGSDGLLDETKLSKQ